MSRRGLIKTAMWSLAATYPAFSLFTFFALQGENPIVNFTPLYLLSTVLLLPPGLMLIAIWLGTRRGAPTWGWTFVLLIWIGSVGFLHYLFIGIAAGRI